MPQVKCTFIMTEYDIDMGGIPFYEKDRPLGDRINAALEAVFDGIHCPCLTHVEQDGTGFIAITSEQMTNAALEILYSEWLERELEDPEVLLATPDGELV